MLEVIAANHPHSVEECCKSMFQKWLNEEDANWNQLTDALNIIVRIIINSRILK